MSGLTDNLVELVGDGMSPSVGAFSFRESHVVRTWRLPNPNGENSSTPGLQPSQLQQILQDILGTTQYKSSDSAPGRLDRTLPLADGLFPWLYAESIQSFRGVGCFEYQNPQLNTNDATFPGYALYTGYEIVINCTSRNYPVSPDSSISKQSVVWYDSSNTKQTYDYYPEWQRFCTWDLLPQEEWLDQQRGTLYFQTLSNNEPGSNAQATSQQDVRMLLPDGTLRLFWVGVPMRYIISANSYLNKFRGFVNQNAWNGPLGAVIDSPQGPNNTNGTAGIFGPGSLLYVGYKPTTYSPVFPVSTTLWGSFIDYSKLCDIELFFKYTSRVGTDLPAQPSNKNIVGGGWNLLPYLPKRKFYYAYGKDLGGNDNASFLSFPIELLFTDPDINGAYTGNG